MDKIKQLIIELVKAIFGQSFEVVDPLTAAPKQPVFSSIWIELVYKLAISPYPQHIKEARLAQWILESGRGTSELAIKHFNFGGFKWRSEMSLYGQSVLIKVPSEDLPQAFVDFNSIQDFIDGAQAFMKRAPYVPTKWELTTTAEQYISAIGKVYATDPNYISKVVAMIPEAKTLLAQYADVSVNEPVRPDQSLDLGEDDNNGHTVPVIMPSAPVFEKVTGVHFKEHGTYKTKTGNADGLVMHYTVSGRSKANAIAVLKYLAKEGLGCMVMDENGIIYVPEDFVIQKDVAYHAGTSTWKGRTAMSTYFMGMEICNWGSAGKEKGCTDLRTVPKSENMHAGTYQKYTEKQEAAFIQFCLWQLKVNPEFKIENIVGHDEIAPTRKSDPGGSLSMSMPKFRELITKLSKEQV